MELSKLVQTGIQNKPPRIVIHGVHGVGKSTLAANAPNPIFLQTEDGLTSIDVPHFPLATELQQVWDYMGTLIAEEHEFKTFVLDTADWLQTLIWNQVCIDNDKDSIEKIGYAKGYIFAMKYFDKFFRGVDKLREKGMAIVILAHNEIKPFNPPDGEAYDRYQIKLHKHAATKLEEWADCVLFANFKVITTENNNKSKVVNSTPQRVLYSSNRPAWRAKTRYPNMPDEMEMDFNVILKSIKGDK